MDRLSNLISIYLDLIINNFFCASQEFATSYIFKVKAEKKSNLISN